MNRNHLIIPDCQVKPGVPLDHLVWAGQLIVDRRPDVIVNLGDFYDMPSLSSYDKGKKSAEGRRYRYDIEAGNQAMDILLGPLRALQEKQKRNKEKVYKPRLVFLIGNHEQRIMRHVEAHPELADHLSYDDFNLAGWEVHDFRQIVEIDGIYYSHFFYNPMTGQPYSGMIDTRLKNIGFTFTQGHVQGFKYGQRELNNGQWITGLVAGSFYLHDEEYKGPQANEHWRGLVYKHNVNNGVYDIEQISMHTLREMYT